MNAGSVNLLPLWICLGVLFVAVVPYFIATMVIAGKLFKKQLVRKNKNMWTRDCSWPDNAEQVEMFKRGEEWAEKYDAYKRDVDIINDGFHLYGEYYDFGNDKAVIIIPGRMEGCHYSHYFSEPYRAGGYNVLCIDNRAHGMSDGKYNCLGLKEYRDVIAWGKLLHDEYGIKEVFLHGICIGSATAVQTLTADGCPDYFSGMAADGMYLTFCESFKNHIIEQKHKTFPVLQEVMMIIRLRCGVDVVHKGPKYCIHKLTKPILFLYTKMDLYSKPEDGQYLFDKCNAPKRLVWFEKGAHSHIRINDEQGYDSAILSFLAEKDNLEK